MTNKSVIIVYATQGGNSRRVAQSIFDLAPKHQFNATIYDIQDFNENFKLNEITDPLVIVSSSIDNGEVPDSASKFWNKLKYLTRKTHPNYLAKLNYTILGLGDSFFLNFCGGPELIHKKFLELGANCFFGPYWADESKGQHLVIGPFKRDVWNAIRKSIRTKRTPLRRIDDSTNESIDQILCCCNLL